MKIINVEKPAEEVTKLSWMEDLNKEILAMMGIDLEQVDSDALESIYKSIGIGTMLKGMVAMMKVGRAAFGDGSVSTVDAIKSSLTFASAVDPTGIAALILVFVHPNC